VTLTHAPPGTVSLVTPPAPPRARDRSDAGRRRAAGIYGTVITAAVLAAGGSTLSTRALELTVLVTILVYWVAEQYAVLLGEHTHAGRLPNVAQIRATFSSSWPMVTSSFIPLVALFVARLLGASTLGSAAIALGVTVVLLITHGYAASKAAGLRGSRRFLATATAGMLGVVMILLKALLQHQHHLY
jgi:hypothetical protein